MLLLLTVSFLAPNNSMVILAVTVVGTVFQPGQRNCSAFLYKHLLEQAQGQSVHGTR